MAGAELAPSGFNVRLFSGLENIPPFNPDHEFENNPGVLHWRKEISEAAALLICSPEYAHGIPGTLKNALDWIVGSAELDKKRIGVINASPLPENGNAYALENLVEVLRTMSADVRPEFILRINSVKAKLNAEGKVTDEKTRIELTELLKKLT